MLALLLPRLYRAPPRPLSAELFDFMRDLARTSRSREQKEPAWLSFFADLYPPWPRRQRGIKRQTRLADSQLNFCSKHLLAFILDVCWPD